MVKVERVEVEPEDVTLSQFHLVVTDRGFRSLAQCTAEVQVKSELGLPQELYRSGSLGHHCVNVVFDQRVHIIYSAVYRLVCRCERVKINHIEAVIRAVGLRLVNRD